MDQGSDPRKVIERHRARVLAIPGVVGLSYGPKPGAPESRCLLVHASRTDWPSDLPREIEGYEVVLVPVREGFRAL